MRDSLNVAQVAAARPDYMGFIFYPPSPRDCSGTDPSVVRQLPSEVTPVAVTVNMDTASILRLTDKYGFRIVQLHGDESPEMCGNLKREGLTVFKAIGIKDEESLRKINEYEGCVDMFVFDTSSAARGGTGKKFDWNLLERYSGTTPFLLSGGISPEDASLIKKFSHDRMAGIDLNSKFESAPAIKDVALLGNFIKQIKI
ncbi:MAG: phosphoribosylanthranilate isomerase [Muribaculaceae bacterium]|nr:phosphoribosylanthranilate isomerase [Muribaculaceae bacterium]MDE6753727.1 phosphoribosylanthranilate isomerase [Muribaculaceae bacterium]